MSEKDGQGQNTSDDEEPESTVSVGEEADTEDANSVHNAVKSLATAFMVIHHQESTLHQSEEFQPEVSSPGGGGDTALKEPEQLLLSPSCHSEGPLPLPAPQAEVQGGSEAELPPRGSNCLVKLGVEPEDQGLPAGAQADQQCQMPEAEGSSQVPQFPVQASLLAAEVNGPTSPPPSGEQVPAGVPGCEPNMQPPPPAAAQGLPAAASATPQLPEVADANLERAD